LVLIDREESLLSLGAFKSAKQLACSPSDWTWLVLVYRSNQLY